jgi:dCTP diphosphatase
MSALCAGALGAEVRRTAFPVHASGSGGRVCHSGAVSTTPEPQLDELTRLMREFTAERDWEQFHDPKSLILALVGEVGELAELFQWVPAGEAVASLDEPGRRARVGEEIADVLLYLLRLADVLGVDVMEVAHSKQALDRERFPPGEVHGVAPAKE